MQIQRKRSLFSLSVFLAGLLVTIIALQFPATKQFIIEIGQSGIFGSFLAGILYAFAFTSIAATAIFANTAHNLNPFILALIGGLGAALYDLTVFGFVRNQASHGLLQSLRSRIMHQRRMPSWLLSFIGLIILASPLPDELASGFLGFTKLSAKSFILISFLANVAGIFIILLLSRA